MAFVINATAALVRAGRPSRWSSLLKLRTLYLGVAFVMVAAVALYAFRKHKRRELFEQINSWGEFEQVRFRVAATIGDDELLRMVQRERPG